MTVLCPNVNVVKTGNGPIVNGQTATFTITVTNAGPGLAKGVTLTDQLPAGSWTLGGADKAACSISASNLLTCDFGDIAAPGEEADSDRQITVSKTATTDDCGTIPNDVTVAAANEAAADTDDNTDDATIDVRCPGVDLHKTVSDPTVEPNQTVTYTIVVSVASGPVTNAVVTDDLPVGQTLRRRHGDPVAAGGRSNGGKTLTWTFASLPTATRPSRSPTTSTIDADAIGRSAAERGRGLRVDEDTPCASAVALGHPAVPSHPDRQDGRRCR